MSDYPIFPVTTVVVPATHSLRVDAVVHNFGAMQEQRIVTDLAYTRADGMGGVTKYVGRNRFTVKYPRVPWDNSPRSENALLEDEFKKGWEFFQDSFYDSSADTIQWNPFYWYNKMENDALVTWTGSDVPGGGPHTNGRGETVTNTTGRYLVRWNEPMMSVQQFQQCFFEFGLDLIEVSA